MLPARSRDAVSLTTAAPQADSGFDATSVDAAGALGLPGGHAARMFSTLRPTGSRRSIPRPRWTASSCGSLLVLNLALWYVPAALTGPIFRIAARFRLDADRWLRALAIHGARGVAFSIMHGAAMLGVRADRSGRTCVEMPAAAVVSLRAEQLSAQSRLVADDLRGDRRPELRARLLPRVAGARAQGGTSRDQPDGGAAEDARGRTAPALPVQHAARDLDAGAHQSGSRRSDDQPAERSAAADVRSLRRGRRAAARRSSSSCRSTSRSSRSASRIG